MQDLTELKGRRLTIREYANHLGISLQTVYRRVWQGELQAEQFLGRWLIYVDQPGTSAERDLEVVGVNQE